MAHTQVANFALYLMTESPQLQYFNRTYAAWKSGVTYVVVTSVCRLIDETWTVLLARVELSPRALSESQNEVVLTPDLRFGREHFAVTTEELDQFFADIRSGYISGLPVELRLPSDLPLTRYAAGHQTEPSYFAQQLEVRSDSRLAQNRPIDYAQINADLRAADTPFDGILDAMSYFELGNAAILPNEHRIHLVIHPPCDLIIAETTLSQNKLRLTAHRRTTVDPRSIIIGIRQFPNPSFKRRRRLTEQFRWQHIGNGFEEGTLEIDLDNCAMAELMVTFGGSTVRRHYVSDPHKSLNARLTDYRVFDPALEELQKTLNAAKGDARKLEVGVATLLYLLGATTVNPPSKNSPDVIVETAGKRVMLVECTTKMEDVRGKVGKLVHRRAELVASQAKAGTQREVMAILVVNQQADSLSNESAFLLEHQIVLLTREDLDRAIQLVDVPTNLDQQFVERMDLMRNQLAMSAATFDSQSSISP